MLGNLLRYEIPALGRRLMPLYLGWIFTAVLLGVSLNWFPDSWFLNVVTILLYTAAATAVMVMAVVLIIQRYNNDLMGDGGYFSHALPVTASQHILSKTISAMLFVFLSWVAMIITALIIGILTGTLQDFLAIDWREFFSMLNGVDVFLIAVGSLISSAKSIIAIYAAITIGHQARSHTVLACIGAYMGLMVLESAAVRISIPLVAWDVFNVGYPTHMTLFLAVLLAVSAALCAIYFFICKFLMEKHLNLS